MKLKGKNKVSPDFSMASMTDIVFLLLIFFLITSNVQQNALDVKLPEAKGNASQQETVTVTITKEGRFYVGEDEFTKENIEGGIISKLRENQDSTFIIIADKETGYGNAVFVMALANRNQYKVVLATDPNATTPTTNETTAQ